jgi:hypothetical protein
VSAGRVGQWWRWAALGTRGAGAEDAGMEAVVSVGRRARCPDPFRHRSVTAGSAGSFEQMHTDRHR